MESIFTAIGALVSGMVSGIVIAYALIGTAKGTVWATKTIANGHSGGVWVVVALTAISALCANVALLIHMLV